MAKHLDLSSLVNETDKKSNKNSFIMIYDDIDNEVAKYVTQYIIENTFSPKDERPDVINMLINSDGGSLSDAFAIIDVMASCSIPIRTIGLGTIASAALMIFLAGAKGQRILTPNTSILSHRWSGGSGGKSHELFAVQKEHVLTNERMFHHYKKYTGLTDAAIHKHLLPPEDIFLSAEEALHYKLCDKIALI